MARCLRCRAGNEWIEGGKPDDDELTSLRAEVERLRADRTDRMLRCALEKQDVESLREIIRAAIPGWTWDDPTHDPLHAHPFEQIVRTALACVTARAEKAEAEIERLRAVAQAAEAYRTAEEDRYAALAALEQRQEDEDIDHQPNDWPEKQAYREAVRVQGVKRKALDAALAAWKGEK